MKQIFYFLWICAFAFITSTVVGQGTTTSGLNGKITDTDGAALTGATIIALELETGSQYGTISDDKGFFRIPNMNPGGPYNVTVSFVGFRTFERAGLYLSLGQTMRIDVQLSESAAQLSGVEVVALKNDIFDGNRTGAETSISQDAINQVPTLGRELGDYIRLTPQASFREGGISMAGSNNRYNAISIDGAVNNDVFGLSATGANGGQTGGTPMSMDVIDQFQVQMAPYDVRQSGFAGASINAVTKRGTNGWNGTAYFFMQNQSLAGKTPYESVKNLEDPEGARKKLDDFSDYIYGLSVGGPIVKDKVFLFFNAELQRQKTPEQYIFGNYQGESSQAEIDAFANKLKNDYGYDPGTYLDATDELNSEKIFARIDWNINKNHKLMFRHSYVNNEAIQPYSSSNQDLFFYNSGRIFPSITNSTALELKSNWDEFSNNLIIGFTAVRDDRDPLGDNFPTILIDDGGADINAGSEPYSTANQLDQDILTLTNNFSIYKGAHTITVGVNFEYSNTYNLFMRKNFGEYEYNSLADFMTVGTANEVPAYQYDRNYSLVDDVVGDGSKAAAEFSVLTMGIYAQDEWWASENFKLTFGLRIDVPIFLDNQLEATGFNDEVIPVIEETFDPVNGKNYDMQGAQSGKMPKSQIMFAPRVGFTWDVTGEQTTQLRGGIGLFTSRIPLVWPGGAYTNNGMTVGGVYHRSSWGTPITFRPDWQNQYTYSDFNEGEEPIPSGQMDLFAKDFKFPQVFRTSVAVDHKLPWGLVGTLEAIYTKTINNMIYYNYNVTPAEKRMTGGPDDRYINPDSESIDSRYSRIMLGANTSKGYSFNITAQIQKSFANGFQGSIAYTYGQSKSMNDGLSSQNSSQWRYTPSVNGRNHLDLAYSNFDMGSRVMAFIGYTADYADNFATGISIFYDGVSGQRFSYAIDNSRGINDEDSRDYLLIWIPKDQSEIILNPYEDDGVTVTAEEQWNNLNGFIENDPYLKENRGNYCERNGARMPFESYLDARITQDFYINAGKSKHTLQLTLDIFNVLNLLNKEWGVHRSVYNSTYELVSFDGFKEDGTTPTYTYERGTERDQVWNISDPVSRWRMQFGIRYIFGQTKN